MSYQEKGFLGASSYYYGQEVLDVLQISQLMSPNSMSAAKLESNLVDIITRCRSHYIGQPELATDSDSKIVFLCFLFEQILSHGLRNKVNFSSNSSNIQQLMSYLREFNITNKSKLEFWNCVSYILPTQERERILSLRSICTDVGRGRAWLRSALNERSLERHLKCLLSESEVLEQFYEPKSWVRDQDKQKVLLKAAADITSIVFALPIDYPDLNQNSPESAQLLLKHATEPVILPSHTPPNSPHPSNSPRLHSPVSGTPSSSPSKLRRAKKPTQSIISFDEGEKGTLVTKPSEGNKSSEMFAGGNDSGKSNVDFLSNIDSFSNVGIDSGRNSNGLDFYTDKLDTSLNVDSTNVIHPVNSISAGSKNSGNQSETFPGLSDLKAENVHNTPINVLPHAYSQHKIHSQLAQESSSENRNSTKSAPAGNGKDTRHLHRTDGINSRGMTSNEESSNSIRAKTNQGSNNSSPVNNSKGQPTTNIFLGTKTSDDPSFYLTPSSLGLAPSNSALSPSNNFGEFPRSNSSRSSQDSLLEDGSRLGSEIPDIMSVSQYSEARSELSEYRSEAGRSHNRSLSELSSVSTSTLDDCGGSVYSSATSNTEFPGLRILGDTGIGELTPLTSFIASEGEGFDSADERALDATLYTDGNSRGFDGNSRAFPMTDEEEEEGDSLSICSTSDGRVSASHGSAVGAGGPSTREKLSRYEAQIQELNRENELLKHQLRKYVTAVQLLNKQHTASSTSCSLSEAEQEARSYEAKLGQLAEMHSELLEMNQKLKLDLNTKEATVEKLTAELMTLRGVKPSPVSLWLPCVFLGGPPSDPHHIYQIHIRVGTEEWNVYRRYSDFYSFHKSLSRRYPGTLKSLPSSVKFPPKNLIFNKGNKSALFVEERRQKLELYLRAIVTTLVDMEGSSGAGSGQNKLNKFALVSLIPFLNDFFKSANVARNAPPVSTSINPIKRLSTSCLKPHSSSPPTAGQDALSCNHSNTTLQYTGL